MATLDLASLATETSQRLHALWDEMGVPSDARGAALEQLAHDVAAIYSSRVAAEASRKSGIEGEIASLQTTINNMIHAMDEAAGVVRAPQGPECSAGGRRTERSAPHPAGFLEHPFAASVRGTTSRPAPISLACPFLVIIAACKQRRAPHRVPRHPRGDPRLHAGGEPFSKCPSRCAPAHRHSALTRHPSPPPLLVLQTWDARYAELKSQEATLFQLYEDIGAQAEVRRLRLPPPFPPPRHSPPIPTPIPLVGPLRCHRREDVRLPHPRLHVRGVPRLRHQGRAAERHHLPLRGDRDTVGGARLRTRGRVRRVHRAAGECGEWCGRNERQRVRDSTSNGRGLASHPPPSPCFLPPFPPLFHSTRAPASGGPPARSRCCSPRPPASPRRRPCARSASW
jgi:hypothetical protein